MATEAEEADGIIRPRLATLARLDWEALDRYGEQVEEVTTASRREFRVTSLVFWDMEPWASGMYIIVKARPTCGWRRYWPYKGVAERGAPGDPVPERPPTSTGT